MFGHVPKVVWQKMTTPDEYNRVPIACPCLVVRAKDRVVVGDVGMGTKWNAKERDLYGLVPNRFADLLAPCGIAPTDVTDIVLTHLHIDHAGGLTEFGEDGTPRLVFPNAKVFVQSIAQGEPVSGATVEVIGKNGLPIVSRHTDGSGLADIPSLDGFRNEQSPLAYVIRDNGDMSFMALDRSDRGTGTLTEPYIHYNFSKGISDWLARHNTYSASEADRILSETSTLMQAWGEFQRGETPEKKKQALKRCADFLPFRPLVRFMYLYIWKWGFLDGHAGFDYSVLMALYDYLIKLKVRELRQRRRGNHE